VHMLRRSFLHLGAAALRLLHAHSLPPLIWSGTGRATLPIVRITRTLVLPASTPPLTLKAGDRLAIASSPHGTVLLLKRAGESLWERVP